jgi:hypothetical protein
VKRGLNSPPYSGRTDSLWPFHKFCDKPAISLQVTHLSGRMLRFRLFLGDGLVYGQ